MRKTPTWRKPAWKRSTNNPMRPAEAALPGFSLFLKENSTALASGELEALTEAWAIWASSAPTPLRSIARARAHLVFLLIRHGGLRLGEALAISPDGQLDLESGQLEVAGDNARRVFLSPGGVRSLRRILTLPEARDANFNRLDPGFVRRTFYALAKNAGLDSARCGPRALRYARGLELLGLHMPLNLVREYLGLRAPGQFAAFLQFGGLQTGGKALREKQTSHGVRGNAFMAIVTDIETGLKSALVRLNTLSGLPLASLCPMNEFISADPAPGQTLWAFIDPGMIFISRHAGSPDFANYFSGKLCSFRQDPVEGLLGLALADGALLEARIGNLELPDPAPENGERLFARFSARAVAICAN